jgi:hypothetical protein
MVGSAATFDALVLDVDCSSVSSAALPALPWREAVRLREGGRSARLAPGGCVARGLSSEIVRRRLARHGRACPDGFLHERWTDGLRRDSGREP